MPVFIAVDCVALQCPPSWGAGESSLAYQEGETSAVKIATLFWKRSIFIHNHTEDAGRKTLSHCQLFPNHLRNKERIVSGRCFSVSFCSPPQVLKIDAAGPGPRVAWCWSTSRIWLACRARSSPPTSLAAPASQGSQCSAIGGATVHNFPAAHSATHQPAEHKQNPTFLRDISSRVFCGVIDFAVLRRKFHWNPAAPVNGEYKRSVLFCTAGEFSRFSYLLASVENFLWGSKCTEQGWAFPVVLLCIRVCQLFMVVVVDIEFCLFSSWQTFRILPFWEL